MNVSILSLAVAERVVPTEILDSVRKDINSRINDAEDTTHLGLEPDVLAFSGIIVQICAIAVQIAAIIVQTRSSSKEDAVVKLLEEIATRTGDADVAENKKVREVAEAVVDEISED